MEQNWLADRSTYPEVFDASISSLRVNDGRQYRYRFGYYWTVRPTILLNLRTGVTRTPRAIGTQGLENDQAGVELGIRGVSNPNAPFVGISEGQWIGIGPVPQSANGPQAPNQPVALMQEDPA